MPDIEELTPEPEITPEPTPEPEPEPEPTPPAEIDYDRLADAVAQRMQPKAPQPEPVQGDPYQAIADKLWEDPAAALREYGEVVRTQTMQAMAPYVQPVAQNYAMSQVTQGLPPEGVAAVQQFITENQMDPAMLNNPQVAKLVRGYGEAEAYKKSGAQFAKPVPSTEGAYASNPYGNVDADTTREVDAMSKLAASLGVKFDPSKLMGGR